ncbi:AfsR/SARP family transcriptional regulator [Actinokineospora sp. HUAS TT18]|uniref:AfsR/SARP family transcriptional regulator n=1 Tax=Actinokineospora sp. HUAS TT18 TaxID=3447451 RepID=UPI003F521A69
MTRFAVLGPLECWSGNRQIDIRGPLQRSLLAALLATESRPVSVESLVTELWGDTPPDQWENALQAHVSRLRRRLTSIADEAPARLIGLATGYRLVVSETDLDATAFTRQVAHARAIAATDPTEAADVLRSALALWRGPAFAMVAGGPLCRAAAHRYEAARTMALETLFDTELQTGRHVDIIPRLRELVESSGLNERFCEQLMVALYRSGRQAEALATYRRMRHRLDDELGVLPTRTLRNHEKAILVHHPALHTRANHTTLRE